MIDPKYIELIHQEIDGRISPKDHEKLKHYLEANPEAKQLMADLRNLSTLLENTEEVEPPIELRERILQSVDFHKYPLPQRQHPLKSLMAYRPRFRYAYAFAGGFAFGLLIALLLMGEIFKTAPFDLRELSGAMISKEVSEKFQTAFQLNIEADGVEGKVTVDSDGNLVRIALDVKAEGEIELAIEYEADALRFEGFQRLGENPISLNIAQASIELVFTGNNRSILLFGNQRQFIPEMKLKLRSSGSLIYERTLSARQTGPGR
jgi:hypothetical protein